MTALEPGTLEFCKLERLTTLGEFAVFAQNMSQNVIVGGDFRRDRGAEPVPLGHPWRDRRRPGDRGE